ncbi:protease modulator HflC [Buchnera aphidicola]|uniref:protease modulator HflC n=1 Tax=Buchnera aphidicola TaxID=9 RepID=UPI003BEF3B39
MSKFFLSLFSLLFLFVFSSFFVIQEGERGIILQFGKVLRNNTNKTVVYTPGLHFKWPFLDTVKILDSRIHTINNELDHVVTKDKKEIIIESYVRWKISDFSRYYLNTEGKKIWQIETLLKHYINDQLRLYASNVDIKDIISHADTRLTCCILNNINTISVLGINVLDFRIKKINFSESMYHTIYNRMNLEQELIAQNKRSEGYEKEKKLRSYTDYKISIILAKSEKKALIIRSQAEAKVTKLFAKNFSKEPDFYLFIRSLRAYENIFQKNNNVIILNIDSDFFSVHTKKNNIIN